MPDDDPSFYDSKNYVECYVNDDPTQAGTPIYVTLPTMVDLTAAQARAFGLALIKQADFVDANPDRFKPADK